MTIKAGGREMDNLRCLAEKNYRHQSWSMKVQSQTKTGHLTLARGGHGLRSGISKSKGQNPAGDNQRTVTFTENSL